jgi:uncharacterized membrane protein YuzA (DUF378 family)
MSDEALEPSGQSQEQLAFHEHGRDQLTKQLRSYGEELIRESVDTARSRKHPLVQRRDVQDAAHRLHIEFRDRTNVVLQIFGAGLIGIFLQGFAFEMLAESPSPWAVVVYVVVGFAGLFGVFWSLLR